MHCKLPWVLSVWPFSKPWRLRIPLRRVPSLWADGKKRRLVFACISLKDLPGGWRCLVKNVIETNFELLSFWEFFVHISTCKNAPGLVFNDSSPRLSPFFGGSGCDAEKTFPCGNSILTFPCLYDWWCNTICCWFYFGYKSCSSGVSMSIKRDSWRDVSTILTHWMAQNLCMSCNASWTDAGKTSQFGSNYGQSAFSNHWNCTEHI